MFLFSKLLMVVTSLQVAGQAPQVKPSDVQIVVLASPHLRQINRDSIPVDVDRIRTALSAFKPDHIVVEWLHPSIAPESTFNYRSLGDRTTLARLWGYDLSHLGEALDSLQGAVTAARDRPSVARARVALGKVYYLNGDQANAAYQWYNAGQLGGDIVEVTRLVRPLLAGHEAAEFGFYLGAQHGVEFVTAFDYQGAGAGTLVWGEMLEALRKAAVRQIDGIDERNPAWEARGKIFDSLRNLFENRGDSSWIRRFGSVPEVRQYLAVLDGFAWANRQTPRLTDGLTYIRWLQSPEYEAVERAVQTRFIAGIQFGGFGQKRLEGIMFRNRRMVDFAEADILRSGKRRVLIIVGAQHKFALEDLLRAREYRVVPSRELMP